VIYWISDNHTSTQAIIVMLLMKSIFHQWNGHYFAIVEMSSGFRSSCYWTDWNWANTENIRIGLVFAVLAQWKFLYCIDRFDHTDIFRIGPIPVSPITTRSESARHFDNCKEKSREILDWFINKGIITWCFSYWPSHRSSVCCIGVRLRLQYIILHSLANIYIIMWSCPGCMPKYYPGNMPKYYSTK
jgi:energy-coupling factor transporter transmembrane protein EcfT